jgi:hypothetical protein
MPAKEPASWLSRQVSNLNSSDPERAHFSAFMTRKQILDTIEKTYYKLERILTFLPRDAIYICKVKD